MYIYTATDAARNDSLDLARGGTDYEKWNLRTGAALVEAHDKYRSEARESLARTNDEHLMTTWRLLVAGKTVSEYPRYIMLRDSVFNHLAHHRGTVNGLPASDGRFGPGDLRAFGG